MGTNACECVQVQYSLPSHLMACNLAEKDRSDACVEASQIVILTDK